MKLELLQEIHGNPEYYSGYVTREVIGNLNLNGTAHAEQNHSSIVSFNGDSLLGSILDHLKSLMERQQHICNKENDLETDNLIRTNHYTPTLDRDMGYEECAAKQSLSQVPHKEYFVKQLKRSELLQMSFDNEISSHMVWPTGVDFDINDEEHVVIKVGHRCNCWRRVDFDIQCKHELRINPKFKVLDWGNRWLSRREFNKLYPNMSTFDTTARSIELDNDIVNNQGDDTVTCLDKNNGNNVIDDFVFNSILDKHNSKVTYSDLLELATDLCRTVSADPKLCRSTYGTLFDWITKLREGQIFELSFNNKGLPKTGEKVKTPSPLAAVITPPLRGRKTRKRYKSSTELSRSFRKKKSRQTSCEDSVTSLNEGEASDECNNRNKDNCSRARNNIDELYVVPRNSDKRFCYLCRQPRCTRWTCNILQSYEKLPGRLLVKGNLEVRDRLINLIATVDNHVLCHNRDDNDKRLVYVELPRKIKAIIVHKKYIIEQNLSNISQHDNVCVECTLLGDYGNVIEKYNKALFTKHCVTRHIGKSKNNLVVDNLS